MMSHILTYIILYIQRKADQSTKINKNYID